MSDFRAPRVMGIINCTPDSFFPGSRSGDAPEALLAARRMIADGADILDFGGESTRPGSSDVDPLEQINRVVPAIRAVREESDITISVDTRSAAVARAALDAGADIINDISALSDPEMAVLAAERNVPIVLMHIQGTPESMQEKPVYGDVVREVRDSLLEAAGQALDAGVSRENIILDPGIGFGKRHKDNLELLGRIPEWKPEGYRILIGLSRKSFLGRIADPGAGEGTPADSPEDRLIPTVAAHAWCLGKNVDILRVHDVKETRQLISVWEALAWAS